MSEQTDQMLERQAKELVIAHFRQIVNLAPSQPKEGWEAAIRSAELTIDEKIKTVEHQRELFGTAMALVAEITPQGDQLLKQWCNEHIQELQKLRLYVSKERKAQVTARITHISSDGTETVKEISQ